MSERGAVGERGCRIVDKQQQHQTNQRSHKRERKKERGGRNRSAVRGEGSTKGRRCDCVCVMCAANHACCLLQLLEVSRFRWILFVFCSLSTRTTTEMNEGTKVRGKMSRRERTRERHIWMQNTTESTLSLSFIVSDVWLLRWSMCVFWVISFAARS